MARTPSRTGGKKRSASSPRGTKHSSSLTKTTKKSVTQPSTNMSPPKRPLSTPLQVSAADIASLFDHEFKEFMKALIRNEAWQLGISTDNVQVGDEIRAPDEGADAITTNNSAIASNLIPAGKTVWQFKAEKGAPSEKELLKEFKKPAVQKCLQEGGSYAFVAQQPSVPASVEKKQAYLRGLAKKHGFREDAVRFYAASALEAFAERYPALARLLFFRKPLGDIILGTEWSGETKHKVTFQGVANRGQELNAIQTWLTSPGRTHVRIVGAAGVGKTRLALEAIRAAGLLYATAYAPSGNSEALRAYIRWSGTGHSFGVLVIDECSNEQWMELLDQQKDFFGFIKLITIGHTDGNSNKPGALDCLWFLLKPLDVSEVVQILKEGYPHLPPERIQWVAEKTGGWVKLAQLLADAVVTVPILDLTQANEFALVNAYLEKYLGSEAKVKLLQIIGLFRRVGIANEAKAELVAICKWLNISELDAYDALAKADAKNILASQGRYRYLTPELLSIWLGTRFIRVAGPLMRSLWTECPPSLQDALLDKLSSFKSLPEARAFVEELLGRAGPFGEAETLDTVLGARLLFRAGLIAPELAISRLEEYVEARNIEQLQKKRDSRRELVWFLERVIWSAATFERAFPVLLRLARAESEPGLGNNATEVVGAVFGVYLGATEAPFPERLALAKRLFQPADPVTRKILVTAVERAFILQEVGIISPQSHWGIGEPNYWRPKTWGEDRACRRSALAFAKEALTDAEEYVRVAAQQAIIRHFRELMRVGLASEGIEALETALSTGASFITVCDALEMVVLYDKDHVRPEDMTLVLSALQRLPSTLEARFRIAVGMGSLHSKEERIQRGLKELPDHDAIAEEIFQQSDADTVLSILFEKEAHHAGSFAYVFGGRDTQLVKLAFFISQAQANSNARLAAIYLAGAISKDATGQCFERTRKMLVSAEAIEREIATRALLSVPTHPEVVQFYLAGLRDGTIQPAWLRGIEYGTWILDLSPHDIEALLSALAEANSGEGAVLAVAAAHRAWDSKPFNPDVAVRLLVAAGDGVSGMDEYAWTELAPKVAKLRPVEFGKALIAQLLADPSKYYYRDQLGQALHFCLREASADLTNAVLDALTTPEGKFRVRFLSAVEDWLADLAEIDRLIAWAKLKGDAGQIALAHMLSPGPNPKTLAALEAFGANSTFARILSSQFTSGSWVGSATARYQSLVDSAENWAQDNTFPRSFRSWAASVASEARETMAWWAQHEEESGLR